jgi:hypothetical protein
MQASSLLRSIRSDASSSRRLDEDGAASVVMIPHWLAAAAADGDRLPDKEFPSA